MLISKGVYVAREVHINIRGAKGKHSPYKVKDTEEGVYIIEQVNRNKLRLAKNCSN